MTEFLIPASSVQSIVILLDKNFCIVEINDYAEKLLKRKAKELKGQDYFQLAHKILHIPFLSKDKFSSKKLKKRTHFVTSLTQADGEILTYAWEVTPLVSEEQCPPKVFQQLGRRTSVGARGVYKDVHEHEHTEVQHRQMLKDEGYLLIANALLSEPNDNFFQEHFLVRTYLESILLNIPCYLYWKDKNLVYRGCNNKFAKAAGFKSFKEVIGKTDYDLAWQKTEAELFRQDDERVLAGYAKLNFEESQRQANQKTLTVLASKVPLRNLKGEIAGVLGTYVDITDRKKMEHNLIKAKKRSEDANRAKNEFLSVVSHELRTPLTGILGMAHLLEEEGPSCEGFEGKVEGIIDAGKHLLSLIDDLLNLARFAVNKVKLKLEPVDIRKQIDWVVALLEPQAKKRNIKLLIDCQQGLPDIVMTDSRAIRQIFLNLVGNALKFTEEGYVRIQAKLISKSQKYTTLAFAIKDTGVGIPKEKLSTIFKQFVQVDASITRTYSGIGLGLTISREYLNLMNGKIKVKSRLGEGSTFTFTIPFKIQDSTGLSSLWDQHKSQCRVLVVGDTSYGENICNALGADTQIFSSKKALAALQSAQKQGHPFDIAIMIEDSISDNTTELANRIQANSEKPVMLLLLANKCSVAVLTEAKQAGFVDCLPKSIRHTELLDALAANWVNWLSKRNVFNKEPNDGRQTKQLKLKILLVEDNEIIQKVHSSILAKFGWRVDIASTACSALEKFSKRYDVVLMDIGLPDMTGIECVIAMRKREKEQGIFSPIPIIGVTGYDQAIYRNDYLNAGLSAVITKPITAEKLHETILSQLRACS